jgi:uncharacterized repeat protein (TIGR01451 family)
MNKIKKLASAGALSVVIAGSIVSPALAWHPKGMITKSVQNVTAGGSLQDANSASSAVSAKPGDVLNYVIEVKNIAAPAQKQYNDMAFTVVTDTLPAGVELVSNPTNRTLSEDMGTILPGKSAKVTYQVKVTAATNRVVTNKACFSADSVVKDNPQKGCDDAVVNVTVPQPPVTPTPPSTPAPTVTPVPVTPAAVTTPQPAVLPNAGVGTLAPVIGLLTAAAGYVGYMLHLKRRTA